MDGIRVLWKTLDVEKIISEAFMEKVTFKTRPWKLNGVFWDICKLKELWGEVDTQHPWHIWGGQERAYHSQWMQFMEYILVDSWAISGLAVVPNLWDLMLDDLRWRWCNSNRNKVHSRSFQNYPLAVHGKVVFHKTGPWCQSWRPLLQRTWPFEVGYVDRVMPGGDDYVSREERGMGLSLFIQRCFSWVFHLCKWVKGEL